MVKKSYEIKKFETEEIRWDEVPVLNVHNLLWDKNGYAPVSMGQICYTEKGLHVKLTSYETEITGRFERMNEPVYTDSCMEFFFQINPETDKRYLNFETNCLGTLLLGLGAEREEREQLNFDFRKELQMKSTVTKENLGSYRGPYWTVEYTIPFAFLESIYGPLEIKPGKRIAANVYKCGDETKYEHYMSWNYVGNETPQFHSPEFFGDMFFE